MSKVFLTRGDLSPENEWLNYPFARILASANTDRYRVHVLVESEHDADIIMVASNNDYSPCGLGLYKERVAKCKIENLFLISSQDNPPPIWRGLYASWPISQTNEGIAAGWCYFHPNSAEPFIDQNHTAPNAKWLWSFTGSIKTHATRARIGQLSDDRGRFEDTSSVAQSHLRGETGEAGKNFRIDYIRMLAESKFVLCPRGEGASSMRIFETMKLGRVPVIISDEWLPPMFVQWQECSLRIPESSIGDLPSILRAHEDRADAMGKQAKAEWARVFGESGLFHFAVEACLSLQQADVRHVQSWRRRRMFKLFKLKNALTIARWAKAEMLHRFRIS